MRRPPAAWVLPASGPNRRSIGSSTRRAAPGAAPGSAHGNPSKLALVPCPSAYDTSAPYRAQNSRNCGTGESLVTAKQAWLEAQAWQPVRRLVEDTLVVSDWFENFVAQNLALDGLFHPLVFGRFDAEGQGKGATAVSLLTQPVIDWFADHGKWVDAVVKTAAAESPENRELLSSWFRKWSTRAADAAVALANEVLGKGRGGATVAELHHDQGARALRLGLQEG